MPEEVKLDKGRNKVRPTIRLTLRGFRMLEEMRKPMNVNCNRNEMVESCINFLYMHKKDWRPEQRV